MATIAAFASNEYNEETTATKETTATMENCSLMKRRSSRARTILPVYADRSHDSCATVMKLKIGNTNKYEPLEKAIVVMKLKFI